MFLHFKAYGSSLNQWRRTAGVTLPLTAPSERKGALNIHESIRYPVGCQRARSQIWVYSPDWRICWMAASDRFLWGSSSSSSLDFVPGVDAPLTLAGGTLLGTKGQSNQFHLAKTGVKSFLCASVSAAQCRRLVPHVEGSDSFWTTHERFVISFLLAY